MASGRGAGPRRFLSRFRRARHLDCRAAPKSRVLSFCGIGERAETEEHMPTRRVGRLWKFKASQVDEWVQARKASESEEKA